MFEKPASLSRIIEVERARVWALIARMEEEPVELSSIIDDVIAEATTEGKREQKPRTAVRLTLDFPWEQAIELSPLLWLLEILVRLSVDQESELLLQSDRVRSWLEYAVNHEKQRLAPLKAAATTLRILGAAAAGGQFRERREMIDFILALA